jgi:hypothetical protein
MLISLRIALFELYVDLKPYCAWIENGTPILRLILKIKI